MLTLVVFVCVIIGLLWFDLWSHREGRVISIKNASIWSVFYIVVSLMFAAFLYVTRSPADASLFITAYVLEKVLSVDNLMVFSAVFAYFKIAQRHQHRILYYGIIGAIVMRLIFVLIGTTALEMLGKPVEVIFALLVGYTAYQMIKGIVQGGDEEEVIDHEGKWYIRMAKKIFPVTGDASEPVFFKKVKIYAMLPGGPQNLQYHPGKEGPYITEKKATPFFLCLIAIEMTDVMFAFDSVPTVIAIARDPLIVYSSMIFAILGLRSLYFVLSALQRILIHLDKAVGVVLAFIAAKLLASSLADYHVDPMHSLYIVLGILTLGVIGSLVFPGEQQSEAKSQ